MMKRGLFTVLLCCITNVMLAQYTVKGKVVDEQNQPVANANVWIEYTTQGTSTNSKGEFTLENIPGNGGVLRAKAMGYDGKRTEINIPADNLIITLKQAAFNLNEVVVTGTGTHNKLKNSPVTVNVISKKDLDHVNIPSFEDAMIALNPSLSFTPNAMGSFMQLNGLSNRYILVLVDGKRLAGDVSGNTDLSRINMTNVKRVEILKGAASSLYGSEAIGGVINIITDKRKETVYASSYTKYAKYGQFTQGLNADVNYKWFGSSTSFQRSQTDGWQLNPQELSGDKLIDTEKKAVNASYSDVLNQKFTFTLSDALNLYTQGSLFDKKFKRPTKHYDFNMLYEDYTIGAGAKYMLKELGSVSLDLYTDNFEYIKDYIKESGDFKPGDEELSRRQKYYDANLKGVFNAGAYNRITGGVQYQVDYLDSNTDIKDGSRDVYTFSLYAQDEIRLMNKKLQFVPGVRYVYHETFKNRLTPKLAAMYSLNNFNFRASYSSGFKSPELKYLYCNTETTARGKTTLNIANENLKPETSNYYSATVEYISNFITASVNGYINDVDNIITRYTYDEVPPEYQGQYDVIKQYRNSSKAKIKGIDVTANSYLGAGFSMGLGYSFVDSKDYDTDEPLEKTSKHTGNLNVNWNKAWWILRSNININGRLQSERYYDDGDTRPYNLWNITTSHTFKNIGGLIFEPGFGIENIFDFVDDKPFGANYATLSPGRTFYVSLNIKFSK